MTKKPQGLPAVLDKMLPEFEKALGNTMPATRFIRAAKSTLNGNPDIAKLERTSVLKAIMQAAQDGLVVDGKESAIVPFKGKATYIPMVQGLVKKMRQHSNFANLSHGIIYLKEVESGAFVYEKGDIPSIYHKPMVFEDRGEAIGAYAVLTTKDGEKFRSVLRRDQIVKRLGKGANSAAKKEWEEEFWIKTVIKHLAKLAPNSGDETGYSDGVFSESDSDGVVDHDIEVPKPPVDVTPEPDPMPEEPKQTRTSKLVQDAVVDAEIIPHEYDDLPM